MNSTGEQLIRTLVDKAESRHEQHFGKIHAAWSRAIGLSSRRLSRRTRYAPNDRLLKTLVVAMVDDRMQFDEFLSEARRRYGLDSLTGQKSNHLSQVLIDANKKPPSPMNWKGGFVPRCTDRRVHRLTKGGLKAGVPLKGVARHSPAEERQLVVAASVNFRRYEHHVLSRRESTTCRSEAEPR